MKRALPSIAAASALIVLAAGTLAADATKYTLRYKFKPGETLRWEVEHLSKVRATVSGSTQSTDTASLSLKAWRVKEVKPDGSATFEHRVEWVDMRQTLTGRKEVHYDSRTQSTPPAGFESAAKSVGVPLSIVTIDARGKVIHREEVKAKPNAAPRKSSPQTEGWMTIPMPEKPVAVGESWSLPEDIDVPLEGGAIKKVKAVQQFELQGVKDGVASIHVSTDILTPVDPAVESQLVQHASEGVVRFDIDAGRILSQQMDIDKSVVGFRGDASSIHYVNRFSERLVNRQ
jgi:hypothetical protein